MTTSSITLPVRFAETDAMGVVHHSNYVIWFEAARVALMEAAGTPYREVAAGGNHFAVTKLEVEYRAAARFGDNVQIVATVESIRSRQVKFRYEVYHPEAQTLLATGSTEHICVDLQNRMAKIPAYVVEKLQQMQVSTNASLS
ncbi:MAG: thioesterase family protein [Caldilineaceae bacterium]